MRFWIFIGLIIVALLLPFWCFCIAAVCYAFWRPAYELLVLGVCIDAHYGVSGFAYMYTLTAGLILIAVEGVKPMLMFYDR